MVEEITEETVVAVQQNSCGENIQCDGDVVALFGEFDNDLVTADVDEFERALDLIEEGVDGVRVDDLLVQRGGVDDEVKIYYKDEDDIAGRFGGYRWTIMQDMRELLNAAREQFE